MARHLCPRMLRWMTHLLANSPLPKKNPSPLELPSVSLTSWEPGKPSRSPPEPWGSRGGCVMGRRRRQGCGVGTAGGWDAAGRGTRSSPAQGQTERGKTRWQDSFPLKMMIYAGSVCL